ncbi:NAD(P)-dependent dehydrogenase (short-subunit alcohol dehydrogenase family) [Arenibacter algicola]|uniref:NAD(P)-dependent dehydrogenase (Short-subunit alcohol dehydrogenase family) n=1 Tax=Arenibacter algicola TaxID=616991 RepID=A0ABY3AIN1_9FLAO
MLSINLKGRTAIITGASSGIGFGVAKIMARAGCSVVGCATSKEDSAEAMAFSKMIASESAIGHYKYCDVTDSHQLKELVAETVNQFGGIDILVSNAGINVFKGAKNCTDEEWEFNADINLKSHWKLSQLCRPWLHRSKKGVILIITSNHSEATIPGCFPYNVTKTALKGLVQSLAIEWGPNIRTVGIAPGFIDTDGNQKWFNSFENPDEERRRTIEMHPIKKLGTPEEVGELCAFLASDAASFITGTTILMDGGRSAMMQD